MGEAAIDPDGLDLTNAFGGLGIALGLGLLVGLQRERTHPGLAGLRSFALVTLFGGVAGLLGAGPLTTGLGAIVALVVVGNLLASRQGRVEPGITTEAALLVMYAVGALATRGPHVLAVAVGGTVAVVLQFKEELHGLAARLEARDLRAIFQFVLLSLVILPVLPDRTFGPYEVVNPRQVWWMVVLIVAIGLGGYLAMKAMGDRAGAAVAGLLGGLVSSTATTVGYARRAHAGDVRTDTAERVILLASGVVIVRVLIEIAVVSPGRLLPAAAFPLGILGLALAAAAVVSWRLGRAAPGPDAVSVPNPTELSSALVFGALYAGVLLAVAWARREVGVEGTFAVAVLSGLTDTDAITLSTARLVGEGHLAAGLGWRIVVTAILANLGFKAAVIGFWGGRALLLAIGRWWLLAATIAGLMLAFGAPFSP